MEPIRGPAAGNSPSSAPVEKTPQCQGFAGLLRPTAARFEVPCPVGGPGTVSIFAVGLEVAAADLPRGSEPEDLRERGDKARGTESGSCEAQFAPLDALELALARPPAGTASPLAPVSRDGLVFEASLEQLVRAVAWSGDRRRGTARIELAGSRYAGACVYIESDERGLRLQLDAPAGVDVAALAARLQRRLEGRGLKIDELRIS